jgi:hypothetical protein
MGMRLVLTMFFLIVSNSNSLLSRCSVKSAILSSKLFSSKIGDIISVPSGLVAVFKPKDWTSSDVVSKVKGILSKGMEDRCGKRFKIKVGHGGTLDPLAEGVLVLGIGAGTKLMGEYLSGSKRYQAVAILGDCDTRFLFIFISMLISRFVNYIILDIAMHAFIVSKIIPSSCVLTNYETDVLISSIIIIRHHYYYKNHHEYELDIIMIKKIIMKY